MPYKLSYEGQTYYLGYDQVGTLRTVTDTSGNIVKELTYDTFGNLLNDSSPSMKVPFGFAGGLYDTDTKLIRFGYRDYDAETGKWTAKDPIGFNGGDTNLYGYILQDSVNLIDPEGLAGAGPRRWYIEPPVVVGGRGGNLNPNLPWEYNVNPITGYTRHGLNQAINRNGVGVNPSSINDAVKNPVIPPKCQSNGTIRYKGENATVIINKDGKVVTTWPNNSQGYRIQ